MPGKQDTRAANRHHLVIGASGSGKTSWLRARLAAERAPRVIAWDPDEDYPLPRVRSLAALARALAGSVRAGRPVRVALTVNPDAALFEGFCQCVWAYIGAERPTVVIVEELADVTQPGKAGPYWGMIARRSRKYGATVYAVTQRPAECDKTIYSQAAWKWVGCLANEIDRKRLAPLLAVPLDELAALAPLEFFYKGPGPAAATRGKVRRVNPKVKRGATGGARA